MAPSSPSSPLENSFSALLLRKFKIGAFEISGYDIFVVTGYSITASLMAIMNKAAILAFPFPSFLTALQYFTSAAAVLILGRFNVLSHNALSIEKAIDFLPAAATYFVSLWTNTQMLKHSNVDTFIVFRTATPILVAITEPIFLKKVSFPSVQTLLSLLLILLGAVFYMVFDSNFSVEGYAWATAYLIVITFDMVYIKSVVNNIGLNTWGLVLYNNLLALAFFPPATIIMNEQNDVQGISLASFLSLSTLLPISLSCLFGFIISFFGFACRKQFSATTFTLVGVFNKLLTIAVNTLAWDHHAGSMGLLSLLVCVGGGIWYQQSLSPPSSSPEVSLPVSFTSAPPSAPSPKALLGESERETKREQAKDVFEIGVEEENSSVSESGELEEKDDGGGEEDEKKRLLGT